MSSSHSPASPQQQQSSSPPSQQDNPPAAQHHSNNSNKDSVPSSNSNSNSNNNTPSYTSSQFGDTTLTKVFVGGLAWETTREGVRRHFEQFGEILEAVVITDKATGRSKGYGFVTFRDPEGAKRACENPTPVIEGRRANCNLASLGVRQRPATPQHGGRYRGGGGGGAGRSPARIQTYAGGATSPHNLAYPYHQGFPYSGYGYNPYPQEYLYPPNMIYNGQFFVSPHFAPPMYGSASGGGGGGPPPPPPALGNPAGAATGIFPYHHPNQGFPFHQHVPFQQHHHHQPPPSGEQSPNRNATGGSGGPQPDQQPHDDSKPNNRQERSL